MNNTQTEGKVTNRYDRLIRLFYLVFGAGAFIIYICVCVAAGSADWKVWVLGAVASVCGAAAWGTLASFIVSLVRKDKPEVNKYDLVSKAIYIILFIVATIAFVATGFQYGTLKAWIIAFIAAYGAAAVYGSIAKLIITLVRKDRK